MAVAAASIPDEKETVIIENKTYYYYSSSYFVPTSDAQYQMVPPPQGASVTSPPQNCSVIHVEGKDYCYSNGSFYWMDVQASKFSVIPAPIGAVSRGYLFTGRHYYRDTKWGSVCEIPNLLFQTGLSGRTTSLYRRQDITIHRTIVELYQICSGHLLDRLKGLLLK